MLKIDVHHHYHSPAYQKALDAAGGHPGWPTPQWSKEDSLNLIEAVGIRTAILSNTSPGIEIVKSYEEQRALAREVNEYAAQLRDSAPQKFGFFAAVPSLLDKDGVLTEIKHAFDNLSADGIVLMTRYGDGAMYLGHEQFKDIWTELNAREAVVFIHPTSPVDSSIPNPAMLNPVVDYTHETTRTAADLIMSNRKRENPDCKIILSHAGGTLPFVVNRLAAIAPFVSAQLEKKKSKDEVIEDAKSFYVDLALSQTKLVLDMLLNFFPTDHILYGSDFPYASGDVVEDFAADLHKYSFDEEVKRKVFYENGEKLFPRLKTAEA